MCEKGGKIGDNAQATEQSKSKSDLSACERFKLNAGSANSFRNLEKYPERIRLLNQLPMIHWT